jgi:formylglycine-generating enzyme required for sulfatase activity
MPNKLFISYPSESWMFAQRLAKELADQINEDIFIDYRSVDNVDFAKSILGHLRTSQAVLLIITEYTFADIHKDTDWVRLEIRTALEHKIPIILVRENGLLPPRDLPDDVRAIQGSQGIPFYREFFDPAVAKLRDFLITIRAATHRTADHKAKVLSVSAPPSHSPAAPPPAPSLETAIDLVEAGNYAAALTMLQQLQASNPKSPLKAAIDALIADCENGLVQQEAANEYQTIVKMAQRPTTESAARIAFQEWVRAYPVLVDQLDTADLRSRFPPPKPGERSAAYLPPPFAWIPIPAGQVTIAGASDSYLTQVAFFQVPAFAIAKYPLTNAQYKPFIQAGGYKERRWWTDAGWAQCQHEQWTQPHYWDDTDFNGGEQPVVGVSWYEAVAYCCWLSKQTGDHILLPSELRWQRAAQGDDGRKYPWGNDWLDGSLCNNSVNLNNSQKTTPVRRYEGKGDSPFGVVDMAGNVWEWCSTDWKTGSEDINGTDHRVLRGGSWKRDNTDGFQCASRFRNDPHYRLNYGGFRLALSLPSSE